MDPSAKAGDRCSLLPPACGPDRRGRSSSSTAVLAGGRTGKAAMGAGKAALRGGAAAGKFAVKNNPVTLAVKGGKAFVESGNAEKEQVTYMHPHRSLPSRQRPVFSQKQ